MTTGWDAILNTQADRQQRAITVARAIAGRYGITCDRPFILQDSNHTVIYLAPAPVVAKVGTSPEETSLADEVAVAQFLVSRNAPVVPPTEILPPGPHLEGGLEVTFWQYCPHDPDEPPPEVLGQSLRLLHEALADCPVPLRAWDRFDGVEHVLFNPSALQALSEDDRAFLRRRYVELMSAIATFHPTVRPLHGEPHAANLLRSAHGPRWIDFESTCLGPQEWDLTVLPDELVARFFADVDGDLLRVLRHMRSLCVAVWCWLDPDRSPVLRSAGEYHLRVLYTASI
jgi:hypothetical protein